LSSKFNANTIAKRNLNIHEYQSKTLMDRHGVNTQKWRLATTPEEAEKGAKELSKYANEFANFYYF
jgi:succinyl-CoA synthetase beta subunit